jgi:hypothetical protein
MHSLRQGLIVDFNKITIQVEQGATVSRLIIRHPEPLTEDMLAALFMDTGLRVIKRSLGFHDHGLGDDPDLRKV